MLTVDVLEKSNCIVYYNGIEINNTENKYRIARKCTSQVQNQSHVYGCLINVVIITIILSIRSYIDDIIVLT